MTVPLPSLTAKLAPIADALDDLSHTERVNWMRGLSRRELRSLFALAGQSDPLSIEHFHGDPDQVVPHVGQNSLPLFSSFEKHFVLYNGALQGFNQNPRLVDWFTGPGHFIAYQDNDEVIFDYTKLPDAAPSGFPPLKPNDKGTAQLVYGGLTDRLRRVSAHCVIGAVFKNGKPFHSWFMLTRA